MRQPDFAEERKLGDRRVGGVAAIPIGAAVDFHRLEQMRQTGGGEENIDGHPIIAEDLLGAAGLDFGC